MTILTGEVVSAAIAGSGTQEIVMKTVLLLVQEKNKISPVNGGGISPASNSSQDEHGLISQDVPTLQQ